MFNSVISGERPPAARKIVALNRKLLTSRARFLEKRLEVSLVHRLPCRGRVNVERRTSISSYLILHGRTGARPQRAATKEPLWSRWYVPWLAVAFALIGLLVGAIAAVERVTATHPPPLMPATQSAPAEPESDVEMIGTAER